MRPYVALGVRNRTLMEGYGLLESYRRKIPGTACQIEKALDVGEGFAVRLCHEIEDRKRIRLLMEREIRQEKYTQEFFDSIDSAYKEVVQDIKSFSQTDFSSSSPKELLNYFDRFYQIYVTTVHPMVLAIYASDLQDLFETELRKVFEELDPFSEKITEYTALLLTPTRLTTVQKEEQLLFELQHEIETAGATERESFHMFIEKPEIAEQLRRLATDFGWFHMEYLGEPRTTDEYQRQLWERVEDLKKAEVSWKNQISPKIRLQEITKEQGAFFVQHSQAHLLATLVFAMQEFLIVLDFSKADLVEGLYYGRSLLSELAKRVGLGSWIDVRYLLPEELRNLIRSKKQVGFEYIRERKARWACLLEKGVITPYFGEEAKRVADRLLEKEVLTESKEFKGLTAYPGKIVGVASVVTSASGREKFQQGQILVTIDTTTELTSIIKKSVAIVADQGGLLSHTAIVAREFKIPCIVRTRIGTKLVKDGDTLEVDANAGTVKILN